MTGLFVLAALNFGHLADANVLTPTVRELEMLDEVNYVRTQPKEYAGFIDEYVVYWGSDPEEVAAAKELKSQLARMTPVDSLQWSPTLYRDAHTHGTKIKRTGQFVHSDFDWAENLVCGDEDVRYAVLNLIIDAGVPSRGHRKNILNPENTEFACYEVPGKVGRWDFVFIQEFN